MASSDVPGSLVGETVGKYDVLALLALGGTAEIYLARIGGEAGFEKLVVVKCLHEHLADSDDFVTMFLDEARLGAQLDHSNIVQMLELGQHNGRYYIVMEYLAGMSLAQLARTGRPRLPNQRIPLDVILCLVTQASAGLHYAHERSSDGQPLNIVHRDISPQNLVVSFDGILKVVDFGIAKAEVRQTRTASGTIKGKFAYMAPEQALAKAVDRRTDVFALGVVAHELLTGARLFKRESAYETYQAIIKGDVPVPSSINPEVTDDIDKAVLKALAQKPDDRYPSAQAFGEALLAILHRRGKTASATEVGRFVETHFAPELEEHAKRMRDVLAGQRSSAMSGSWDASEIDGPAPDSEGDELESSFRGATSAETPSAHSARGSEPRPQPLPSRGLVSQPQNDFAEAGETQIELDPMDKFRLAQNAGENQRTLLDPDCGPPDPPPLPGLPKGAKDAPKPAATAKPAAVAKPAAPGATGKPKKTMLMGAPVLRPSRPATAPPVPPKRPATAPPVPPKRPATAPPVAPKRPATAPPRPATAPPPPPGARAASNAPQTAPASSPTLYDPTAAKGPPAAASKPVAATPGVPGLTNTSLPTTNWEAARPPTTATTASTAEPTLLALVIAFFISASIGLGATLLLGSLF